MSVFQGLIIPKLIYETESKINGKIEVFEVGKTRKIVVANTTQSLSWDSPSVPSRVWGRAVDILKENEPGLTNVLVFGLGGGTMQHLISKAFKDIYIVSVEIDAVMIDIAKKYFDIDTIPNHKIINEDACRVLIEPTKYGLSEGTFKAAVIDIYCGERFPDLGKSGNFIAGLKKMIVPGGLIVFNRIYVEEHQDDVNAFIDFLDSYLYDIKSLVIAGVTNSDNVLIFGRV